MSVISDAKEELALKLVNTDPGSDEFKNLTQAVKVLGEQDVNEDKLRFEREKEETRKYERAQDAIVSELDKKIAICNIGINLLEAVSNPGTKILTTILNNRSKDRREIRGYTYEKDGIIASTTFSNVLKENGRYD